MIAQQIILPRGRADSGKAIRFLQALPLDKPFRVTVEDYKPKRSNQQNAYLWSYVYPTICKNFEGWRPEDVHEYMLGRHFGTETLVTPDGEVAGTKPLRRSSKLNKQEFADYVAHIQQLASEHGIFIDDPDPEWFMKDGTKNG